LSLLLLYRTFFQSTLYIFYALCCLLEVNLTRDYLYSESALPLYFSCVHFVETCEGLAFRINTQLYEK
jgi:hypothetical protein